MAALLKSVSLFLMHGRRASRASEAQRRAAAGASSSVSAGHHRGGDSSSSADQRTDRRGQRGGAAGHRGSQGQPQGRRGMQQQQAQPTTGRRGVAGTTAGSSGKCSSAKMVDSLRRRTHFSRAEVEALLKLHRSLAASAQRKPPPRGQPPGIVTPLSIASGDGRRALLDRASFRELLHNSLDLTEEVLMERIFNAFDRRGEGAIDGERWVLGLSVMLRGTPAERRAFCFTVYDLNGDGFVTREEVLQLLAGCMAAPAAADDDPDEGVRDLADMALRKMDADRDGKLSFSDFETAVIAEPLLLEAFGNCLPSDHISDSFLATLL